MRWEKQLLAWSLFFLLACIFCRAASPQAQELRETYSSIRDRLTDLKKDSELVTEQLTTLSERLRESQQEAAEWEAQSTRLSESLTSINEQLSDCLKTIELQEKQLRTSRKCIIGACLAIIAIALLKMLAYFLMFKGIPVPRWLDVLW